MSDYLGNLITRTVSPGVTVRPLLPSLFEPVPVACETKSQPEFEQQNFVEQPPATEPSEELAPTPLSIPTLRQSVLREPQETVPEISPAKRILKASQESEPVPPATSILCQSTPQEPSRIFSPRGDGKASPEPEAPVQSRIFRRAAPTLRDDKLSDSTRRRSDIIKSPLLDVAASASHEVSAREETGRSQPAVALKPVIAQEPRESELPGRLGLQAIVPTIRSFPPIAPLLPAAGTATPTINITIGRVEVRAVAPPAQQRAKPKPATVLSLEDYLRQRAKGVSR
jgi:hypothetical protein